MEDRYYWTDEDLEEFQKLCEPLVRFLQNDHKKCNPNSCIIIQWNGATFFPDSNFVPFNVPD